MVGTVWSEDFSVLLLQCFNTADSVASATALWCHSSRQTSGLSLVICNVWWSVFVPWFSVHMASPYENYCYFWFCLATFPGSLQVRSATTKVCQRRNSGDCQHDIFTGWMSFLSPNQHVTELKEHYFDNVFTVSPLSALALSIGDGKDVRPVKCTSASTETS